MKVIVAGSRSIMDYSLVRGAIEESGFQITEIVSGGARGVDQLGERYAEEHGIPIRQFKPNWKLGRHAGFKANSQMVEHSDALIAIHDGESKGTMDTIRKMRKAGKRVHSIVAD